jgi:type IV pilus assembly protein PilF
MTNNRLRSTLCATGLVLACVVLGPSRIVHSAEPGSRKAIEQAAEVNTELALAYMRENNLKAAREKIDKALQQNARTPSTQMAAGFIYDKLGEQKKAGDHFEQAIKLAGNENPDVVANAAVYFCMNGAPKRGEAYLLQAAASPLNKRADVAYANAGRCAREDKRPKDAEQSFRKALAVNPRQPEALLQMAGLAQDNGNSLQARAFLERYTSISPVTAGTLWLGRNIELGLGDTTQAARYAQQLKEEFPTSQEASLLYDAERTQP